MVGIPGVVPFTSEQPGNDTYRVAAAQNKTIINSSTHGSKVERLVQAPFEEPTVLSLSAVFGLCGTVYSSACSILRKR
ncbi:hypothetical protein SCHPADRAFT_332932 [Schizopora paradoxa]|uniref:Uncharacterized protein n=1 Tax=Schizopora paradoxa TaxID=27342 RepID=A0A0H2RPW2_9AGAM|nr:hypothetical protein SCHPADRAFT_332932 [Schizopora paradoxa]